MPKTEREIKEWADWIDNREMIARIVKVEKLKLVEHLLRVGHGGGNWRRLLNVEKAVLEGRKP